MNFLFAQQQVEGGSSVAMFLPMVLIFAVFYFLIWRPQANERNKHAQMLKKLNKGDRVITRGGIQGKIVDVQGKNKNQLIIEIANNINIKVHRAFISGTQDSFKLPTDQN